MINQDKTIVISIGDANYLPETDHFYKFIDAPLISWTDSKAAAESLPLYYGRQGYLTTITSAVEAAFVGEQSPKVGWIGGTDNEAFGTSEGRWIWATGPEQGTVFWNGERMGVHQPMRIGVVENQIMLQTLSMVMKIMFT